MGVHDPHDPPPLAPSMCAHLRSALRLLRELPAAALARRSGARQALASRQDAGRYVAEVRESPVAARLSAPSFT